ncbi:Arc family DNA-binding protein [Vibrio sp. PID23_8]|uniref:Arc family DNA-binding protein n=1 Tax=Vibrio sp. PID23_8 TaxID=1583767 RepID=UPI001603AAAB|nr:Arc family DNA-binding protein [Vibrio sp. PID23_8]
MSKTPSFPLRIPAETRQYLEEQARANDRSLQKEMLSRIDLTVWMDTTFQNHKFGHSAAAERISNMMEENLEIQKLRAENILLKHELNQHKALIEKLVERFEKGNQSKELNEAYRQACELKETLEKMTLNVPSEE